MLRRMKLFIVAAVVLLLAIQPFRPSPSNPPSDRSHEIRFVLTVEPQVASVIERSCDNCHSNQTVWPWYSHVAPASWLVVSDVNRGRTAMNFSDWGEYSAKQQQEHLERICSEISQGEMPEIQYTIIHPKAKLTEAEKAVICQWTRRAATWIKSDASVQQ